ncbi:MAG TPA: DMT family transporter [Allosphingosinicella sp.]|uniref:DMT family transporter n=1 Tax=Allosphingosinicella sp. TaxID=2823234 RepID=UPI002EDA68F5
MLHQPFKSAEQLRAASTIATPRVLIPFLTVTLIWGSTWLVIRDQLGVVPPAWSVVYRFILASGAMFLISVLMGQRLRFTRREHGFAFTFGVLQFVFNFNTVYPAEQYVTSGLVALIFSLLIIPNSILARILLKQRLSRAFLIGSGIAVSGVALLLINEYRAADTDPDAVLLGVALTLGGVLAVSFANVMQGSARAKAMPMFPMLAWGMLYGLIVDALWALLTSGPPVIEWRTGYILGVVYLGLLGSAVTFPLYYGVVRAIGPGKAAYTSVLIPIIAMALSTLFEGYRWSSLAVAGGVLAMAGMIMALRARAVA